MQNTAVIPQAPHLQPVAIARPELMVERSTFGMDGPRTIVHVLGRATDQIVSFVSPVTAVLSERGLKQTMIVIDDPRDRTMLTKLDAKLPLVRTQADGGRKRVFESLLQALDNAVRLAPKATVHLHGLVPCLLGAYAARFRGLQTPLYFSLYNSGYSQSFDRATALLLGALRARKDEPVRRTITNRSSEVAILKQMIGQPVDLIESFVSNTFFFNPRREGPKPQVVTSSRMHDPRGAGLFAQLAVLLSEESLGLSFNWIGPTDERSTAQLSAAGVGLFNPDHDSQRVTHLRSAWLYVATSRAADFPICLVEAMAMGLPCIALATPQHREVLRHRETGLLCSSENELVACIANLVDSPSYRAALGRAARQEAVNRFNRNTFSAALLESYRATPTSGISLQAPN